VQERVTVPFALVSVNTSGVEPEPADVATSV